MFDTKKMYELGFAFLNAGEVNFHEGAIKKRSVYQNVAGVVNLAFSCELFVKCLLNINVKEKHGHKLDELWMEYKGMCADEAEEIEKIVMKCLKTEMSFDEMLHDDSDVFYNYRYFYDPSRLEEIRNNPLRLQFLRVFAFTLHSYLRRYVE